MTGPGLPSRKQLSSLPRAPPPPIQVAALALDQEPCTGPVRAAEGSWARLPDGVDHQEWNWDI